MSQGCWSWFMRTVLSRDGEYVPLNSRVIYVTSEHRFNELICRKQGLVIVHFSALSCCLYPALHELSATYHSIVFLKVDVKELPIVSKNCHVTRVPSFHFYSDGIKCDDMRFVDKMTLESRIQRHMANTILPWTPALASFGNSMSLQTDVTTYQQLSSVVRVTSETQWEQLWQQNRESSIALVVNFEATWCKPCVMIAPFFQALSQKFPFAIFAIVDIDELESVAEAFDVTSLPYFKLFKSGQLMDERSGAIRDALVSMISKHCDGTTASTDIF
ncbi:hypothetical protein CCR75_001612 [Bremia lactucae]|uniref:Thioredoxin domain-containing protein n=1 Tax=Bremia lactucae TaxID=4779 RepID=A0A976FNR8_BRELC|nr:hypothetical protein CCR75_001612 [Bremia lactucae]